MNQEIDWHEFVVSLRTASYSGAFGRPAKSVGRKIRYDDIEARAIVRSIAIFDIKYGISPREGLGLEVHDEVSI